MALHLTPEMLIGAYEFLRTTPPFRRWKLPHADEVKFSVRSGRDFMGFYDCIRGGHEIAVSVDWIGRTESLLETMAHEMVHMRQALTGFDLDLPDEKWHGADFKRMAALVCRHHGFDPKVF